MIAACAPKGSYPPVHLSAAPSAPQDTVRHVYYVSGGVRVAPDRKGNVIGDLIVGDMALSLIARNGRPLFVLPIGEVKAAQSSVEQNLPSPMAQAFPGTFASGGRAEMLAIEIEKLTGADVLMFRMGTPNTSLPGAAKTNSRKKQSAGR